MPDMTADAKALDTALGTSLRHAQNAEKPPEAIVLSVLRRAIELDIPLTDAKRFLRRRGAAPVRDVVSSRAWRSLAGTATSYAAESPLTRRRRAARRIAIALASGLPAGQASVIAVLGLSVLDHPEDWDRIALHRTVATRLGVTHAAVTARVHKLVDAGVLNITSLAQGVPTKLRFAEPTKEAAARLAEGSVTEFWEALTEGEDTPAVRVLRSILDPAIGYGAIDEATWSVAMSQALGVHRRVLSPARVARASKVLRDLGIDPKDPAAFAAAVHRLSIGAADEKYRAAEAARKVTARERTAEIAEARETDKYIRDVVRPVLDAAVNAPPGAPTTPEEKTKAMAWVKRVSKVAALTAGSEIEVPLRRSLGKSLTAHGWSKDARAVAIASISKAMSIAAPHMETAPLPGVLAAAGAVPTAPHPDDDASEKRAAQWVARMGRICKMVTLSQGDSLLREQLHTALIDAGWSTDRVAVVIATILPAKVKEGEDSA